jgi:hypothetical protein
MCAAIDAAFEVDEVKSIRDEAIALEVYARQAHNVEAERRACEIRLRAERKAGALSARLKKAQGARTDKQPLATMDRGSTKAEQLHKAGISPRQAKNWEKLAAVPDEHFEAALADPTAAPTTSGIIRANAAPRSRPAVSAEALWLWGCLLDFENLLAREPGEIMATMTPSMLDGTHTYAPRVGAWLSKIGKLEVKNGIGSTTTHNHHSADHRYEAGTETYQPVMDRDRGDA